MTIKNNKVAFTMIELLVTISIVSILRTIGFVSYSGQIESSRNSARISDILSISSSLKNHKLKYGTYPNPGDYFNIINSGSSNILAKQGFMNEHVYSTEITSFPTDSFYKIPYFYGVTKNNNYYQLATILEGEDNMTTAKTYLIGDYQTVAKTILPTILLATSTGAGNNIEISSGSALGNINRLTFLVNNGTLNIPYGNNSSVPVSTASSFDSIFSESGTNYSQYPGYSTCSDIYNDGKSVGTGTYQILDNTGNVTNTGCSMQIN